MTVPAFSGWRRSRGTHAPWERVTGADGETKGHVYQRLMDLSELVGGDGTWEYRIMPHEQRPEQFGGQRQGYRNRMMRTR